MNTKKKLFIFVVLGVCFLIGQIAHAQEKEDAEKTRMTVLSLIETLVKNGNMTRAQADTMMREAEKRAQSRIRVTPLAETTPDGKKVVRVPYIPESVKTEMREQIKSEVLAAQSQKNAGSVLGDSGKKFKFVGDIRIRTELNRLDNNNTPTNGLGLKGNNTATRAVTRGADFFSPSSEKINAIPGEVFDPTSNTARERIRVRLGLLGNLSDEFSFGLGISTGSSTGSPTSTNQTLDQGGTSSPGFFNKYAVNWDRAYLRYEPGTGMEINVGRFKNPFIGTDLVWADDLSFDGISASAKTPLNDMSDVFATVGWFPLTTRTSGKTLGRSLTGAQLGWERRFGLKDNKFKLSAGLYKYNNVEGQAEGDYSTATSSYLSSEYPAGARQRGNTLFKINSLESITPGTGTYDKTQCASSNIDANMSSHVDCTNTWGLASSFNELNITSSLDLSQFDPVHMVLTFDMVKNIGYDAAETNSRVGLKLLDLKTFGYLASLKLGSPTIKQRGEWNMSVAYRYVGSDAVLDAFTDSDFGMGGTNNKGLTLKYSYGVAANTWLSFRWMSSDLVDSMIPSALNANNPNTKFSVDSIFIDLNTRF